MDEPINLTEIGFSFAVENLEANIGLIEASQVHWSGISGVKQQTKIELVPCDTLEPWGLQLASSYSQARDNSKAGKASFLCPATGSELQI